MIATRYASQAESIWIENNVCLSSVYEIKYQKNSSSKVLQLVAKKTNKF